jgi:trehalose-6-phosphate synthase
MNILSYRGPGKAGGVSAALMRLAEGSGAEHSWYFLENGTVSGVDGVAAASKYNRIPAEVVDGHYRYCNDFLWPVMHDLGSYASYRLQDHFSYNRFNRIFCRQILNNPCLWPDFVQDYQLALLPLLLRRSATKVGLFWHIPWPRSVPEAYVPAILDIAKALLAADILGFHTAEYAQNFSNFVERYVPLASSVSPELIEHEMATSCQWFVPKNKQQKQSCSPDSHIATKKTRLVVAPLGLDLSYWKSIGDAKQNVSMHPTLLKGPYVFSVDRADYTKGVLNRLEAIEHFFSDYPDLRGKLTFAQVSGRTRPGLASFDQYWQQCQEKLDLLNRRFVTDDWKPVVSFEKPLSAVDLAVLYRRAAIMLVNPLRDGLNLTAKEFISVASDNPGVLLLSREAGVWSELGEQAVAVDPNRPKEMAAIIYRSLGMDKKEKIARHQAMCESLKRNTLAAWCDKFEGLLGNERKVYAQENLKESA